MIHTDYNDSAPWEFWLATAARDRQAARREYRGARRCEVIAKQECSKIDGLADTWHRWAEDHRVHARWHNQKAREAIEHVRKLWPFALETMNRR